jgi:hypothetical protein
MEYLYRNAQLIMSLAISFYKPVDYFSGVYNRFVSWVTGGEFCHCELVIHTTPTEIMEVVKKIYNSAQQSEYAPEDASRIIQQIETNFFSTSFRKHVQTSEKMSLSFSLLWGNPMSVRVLTPTAHDSWFKIPEPSDINVTIQEMSDVSSEQRLNTLKFSLEELGKDYDSSGALCSVLPTWNQEQRKSYDKYFCSEFVVTTFQRLGFLEELSAPHTTPNSLYKYISSSPNFS